MVTGGPVNDFVRHAPMYRLRAAPSPVAPRATTVIAVARGYCHLALDNGVRLFGNYLTALQKYQFSASQLKSGFSGLKPQTFFPTSLNARAVSGCQMTGSSRAV